MERQETVEKEASWRIYLFGKLQVQSAQRTLNQLSMRKLGALLACLVLRSPNPIPREELLSLLWPEEPLDVSRNRLRVLLNALRGHLESPGTLPGSVLKAERYTVQLVARAFTSDYHDFLQALHTAGATEADSDGIAALEKAIALYTGELLAGFYDEWILTERSRIAVLYFQALRTVTKRLEQSALLERALPYARLAVAAEPLDEEAHIDLIRLYQAIGQPSVALRQYEQLERLLRQELSAQPSLQARELAAQIEATLGHGAMHSERTVRPMQPRSSEKTERSELESLPRRLTRFFGREEEISRLCALLHPHAPTRLVTLLGPGGIGKTRLAVETAERLQDLYHGRVYFVPLADMISDQHIGVLLAKALRLPLAPALNPLAQALAVLGQTPTLLVLDNLEQLLPEVAPLIEHLLLEAPPLRCLLTSRLSAGIEGEQEFTVGALPPPEASLDLESLALSPRVALFVDRVRSVRPGFAVTASNVEDVVELCRVLEGLPLAIELAAARARVMTPAEMHARTDGLLNWLVDIRGGKTARHRSVRATLEWSFRLLPVQERRFFAALSAFHGNFSGEAAAYVAFGKEAGLEAAVDLLERLRAASLLTSFETDDATMRFGMLETVREFGRERLAEGGSLLDIQRRHLRYFARMLSEKNDPSAAQERQNGIRILEEDSNVRQALEFGMRSEATLEDQRLALQLAVKLCDYWEQQGRWSEGRSFLKRAVQLEVAATEALHRIEALRGAGALANLMGDYGEARSLSEEGRQQAQSVGDTLGAAGCLKNLGGEAFYRDDYAAARGLYEQALRIYRAEKDAGNIGACLLSLGNVAFFLGDHDEALKHLREALRLSQEKGDRHGIATALLRLGNVRRNQTHNTEARGYLDEARRIFVETGSRYQVALCVHDLGMVAYNQSDYLEAQARYLQAQEMFEAIGYGRGVRSCLFNLGALAQDRGDLGEALSLFTQSIEQCRKEGDRRNLAASLLNLGNVARLQGDYPEAGARYREALHIEQEIGSRGGIVNGKFFLGCLALIQGNLDEARGYLADALETYAAMGIQGGVIETLEAHALLALRSGDPRRAVRLGSASSRLRREIHLVRAHHALDVEAIHTALRTALEPSDYDATWAKGQALSVDAAMAEALDTSQDR